MAAVDVILLSSPHQLAGSHITALSSSPSFPSPRALLQNWPQMRSSNRTAPIQINATRSLANATSLRTQSPVDEGLSLGASATSATSIGDLPSDTLKSKTDKKPRASKGAVDQDEAGPKKLPKSRARKANAEANNEEVSKGKNSRNQRAKKAPDENECVIVEKPPRKSRSKRAVSESQTKLPKGRVTKTSAIIQDKKVVRKKRVETVSRHFKPVPKDQENSFEAGDQSCNNLQLQEAVKRRTNWTPPPPETQEIHMSITPSLEDIFGIAEPNESAKKQLNITDLLSNFAHKGKLERGLPARAVDPIGPKKRKLIELVKTNISTPQNPGTKTSVMKKKPRTITEKATSAYSVNNDQEVAPAQTPLSQYLSHHDLTSEAIECSESLKAPPKSRSNSPTKRSAKAALSKKPVAQTVTLLSPQSALRQVEDQAFVFGTCSQLAREQSPTLLRHLHEAMQASNQGEDSPHERIVNNAATLKSSTTEEQGTSPYQAKRNLWAAASSGVDNWQNDVEIIDLSESPLLTKRIRPVPIEPTRADLTTVKETENHKGLTTKIDIELDAAAKKNISSIDQVSVETGSRQLASREESATAEDQTERLNSSKEATLIKMPDYTSYPTTQLAKEIASYRFKPVKSREQMITLLKRCWEGKQMVARAVQGTTDTSTSSSMQSKQVPQNLELSVPDKAPKNIVIKSGNVTKSTSLRKPATQAKSKEPPVEIATMPLAIRLTPKKKKPTPFLIEEIYDSDTPLTPSPPRRHSSQIPKLPLPLPLRSPITARATKQKSKMNSKAAAKIPDRSQSEQDDLYKAITMAVKSAPRSRDAQAPNWHERILLFDPVILEDLAEWLNSGELAKVGWNKDLDSNQAVSPAEVKAYCLSKSICCLWRENLRGVVRSRY